MPKQPSGFSLIEMMIVVAIVGVISAIAYPSYTEHVKKARRGDARGAMMGLASALERYRANNPGRGYNGAKLPDIYPDKAPIDGPEKFYSLNLNVLNMTYTIRATRYGPQGQDECGDFVLDESGTRSLENNKKSVSECWQ